MIKANTAVAVASPEILFDKVGFGLQISTMIINGAMVASGTISLFLYRQVGDELEELAGSRKAIQVRNWLAEVQKFPEFMTAWGAIEAAIAAWNASNKIL
jgi:hypothetical protein